MGSGTTVAVTEDEDEEEPEADAAGEEETAEAAVAEAAGPTIRQTGAPLRKEFGIANDASSDEESASDALLLTDSIC